MNGLDAEDALKNAGLNGLKTGGVVFATYVISSQLAKTGLANSLSNALIPTAEAITKTFGDDVCKAITLIQRLDKNRVPQSHRRLWHFFISANS